MTYATIIFDGRVVGDDGIIRGSESLPDGLDPILAKYNRILETKLNNVRA